MKVDFMIIGAMKCGTSTLAKILSHHPQVSFSKRKEPHYFNKNWKENLHEYEKLFEQKEGVIYGEGSTSYTQYPKPLNVWDHIYDYNPNTKFIYIVRNPLKRVVSHYMHFFARGKEKQSINEAIVDNPAYLNATRYYMQIKPFIDKFGRDNVLILDFDEFLKNKSLLLKEIADYLKIDLAPMMDFQDVHENVSINQVRINQKIEFLKYKQPFKFVLNSVSDGTKQKLITMSKSLFGKKVSEVPELLPEIKEYIIRALESDIIQFEEITARDYSHWKKFNYTSK